MEEDLVIMNLLRIQSTISCYLSKQFLQVSGEFFRNMFLQIVLLGQLLWNLAKHHKRGGIPWRQVDLHTRPWAISGQCPQRGYRQWLLSTIYSPQWWKQKTELDSLWTTASHRYVPFWAVIDTFCVTCRLFKAKGSQDYNQKQYFCLLLKTQRDGQERILFLLSRSGKLGPGHCFWTWVSM